jgi:hypothetical protein
MEYSRMQVGDIRLFWNERRLIATEEFKKVNRSDATSDDCECNSHADQGGGYSGEKGGHGKKVGRIRKACVFAVQAGIHQQPKPSNISTNI